MALVDEVRQWLEDNWDPDRDLRSWRSILADSGWGCPTWPTEWYGRGLGPSDAEQVRRAFAASGAVGVATGAAMHLAAPTILQHGSDELKQRLLKPAVVGDDRWCQLFSEPGSGSDLAGLTTRAVRDGDEWVVTGQKVWNTAAQVAQFGMLLARTDWDAPKHRGLTWFVAPMGDPGVEVRPIRQMNNYSSFTEVFLNEVRIPSSNVVGQVNQGWSVAQTTLAFERVAAASIGRSEPSGSTGRCAREAAEEAAEYKQTYKWYPQRAGRVDLLAAARSDEPAARELITKALSEDRVARWTAQRARANRSRNAVGPEGSVSKLAATRIARAAATAHAHLHGASALLTGDVTAEILLSTPAISIAGGTDEIQRNILAERVLGLPREPESDKDLPFRQVPHN